MTTSSIRSNIAFKPLVTLPVEESLEDQLTNWGLSISRKISKEGSISFTCLPDLDKLLFESPVIIEKTKHRLKPKRIHEFLSKRNSSRRDIEEISKLVLKPKDGSKSPVFKATKSGNDNDDELVEITFKGVEDVYECMKYWDISFISCNKLFGSMLKGVLSFRFLPTERVKKNIKTRILDDDSEDKGNDYFLRETASCPARLNAEEIQGNLINNDLVQTMLVTKIVAKHTIDNSEPKKYALELKGKTNLKQDFELYASISDTQKKYSLSINDFSAIYKCMLACINNSNVFLCEIKTEPDSKILNFEYFPKSHFGEFGNKVGLQAKVKDLVGSYSITESILDNSVNYKLKVTGSSIDKENEIFSFKANVICDLETNKRKLTIFKIGLFTKEELLKKEEEKLIEKKREIAQERRKSVPKSRPY